ncbi:hypothetical protein VDGL01_12270 [Verticillium dahliae]
MSLSWLPTWPGRLSRRGGFLPTTAPRPPAREIPWPERYGSLHQTRAVSRQTPHSEKRSSFPSRASAPLSHGSCKGACFSDGLCPRAEQNYLPEYKASKPLGEASWTGPPSRRTVSDSTSSASVLPGCQVMARSAQRAPKFARTIDHHHIKSKLDPEKYVITCCSFHHDI